MGNSNKQGNVYELEVKKLLEKEGWSVFRQHRKPVFINGKMIMVGCDVFGADLIAKKSNEKTLWVQVSTRPQKSLKVKQMMMHPYDFNHDTVQLWLREFGKRVYEVFQAPTFESVGIKQAI